MLSDDYAQLYYKLISKPLQSGIEVSMLYSVQPLLRYFGLIGLVPFSEQHGIQQCQKIYTGFLVVINIVVAVLSILYAPIEKELFVSLLASRLVFIAQITTMSIILLRSMCQYDGYFEFCRQMKCLRLRFKCELHLSVEGLPRRRYVKFLVLAICTIGVLAVPICIILYNHYQGYFWYALCADFITRCNCILLIFYVELLGYHLELLSLNLKSLKSRRVLGKCSLLDTSHERLCSFEHLLNLKGIYASLIQLFSHFNGLYGWSILCTFIVMFLDSMTNIYFAFLTLSKVYIFTFLYLTMSAFVPLLLLLWCFCLGGEHCKRQHILIGSHVRRLTRTFQHDLELHAYNSLLDEFSEQVEQNRLTISAEDFMEIDYCLLMSILTAMVTYMVVLVQFGKL